MTGPLVSVRLPEFRPNASGDERETEERHVTDDREPTQLMIVIEAGATGPERLAAALAAGAIVSVVIAPRAGEVLTAADAGPLVTAAQKAGAAALIEGDARLARTLKADGVHLPVSETAEQAFEAAREVVGGRGIVGLDAGRSRHDAMTAGEVGAEYVGFGIPAFVKDRETAVERRLELIDWWAEIFEVPCVAFDVATAEEAGGLAAAGADFIAVRLPASMPPADVAEFVREISAALAGSGAEA